MNAQADAQSTLRIGRTFFEDHEMRELPTPRDHTPGKRLATVRLDDIYLAELADDARFYADPYGPDGPPEIKAAARRLLASLERAGYTYTAENVDRAEAIHRTELAHAY